MSKITFHKGLGKDDAADEEFEPTTLLETVRDKLEKNNFVAEDTEGGPQYRFINQGADKKEIEKDKGIVPKNFEKRVPLSDVIIQDRGTVAITDINGKRPDLVGTACEWFKNRKLKVRVRLNNTDSKAKENNERIGAMEPLVLSNVVPTTDVPGLWDNVCVVVENSIIEFDIKAWAGAGFSFRIKQGTGDVIVDDLYSTVTDETWMGKEHMVIARRYQDQQRTIQITSANAQQIPQNDKVKFQQVTVTTRPLYSYRQHGHVYTYEGAAGYSSMGAETDLSEYVGVIPGAAILHGVPIKGPDSEQEIGGIEVIKVDPWEKATGQVVIYFFVFKDEESARMTINGYNPPPSPTWE